MSFGKASTASQRRNTERKTRDAGGKTSELLSSKMEEKKKKQRTKVNKSPFFVYKRVLDLGDGTDTSTTMDEGVSKIMCENISGCNATVAIAMYSWLMTNVEAWGANQVKTTFFDGDDSGLACVSYENVVLMKSGEQRKISAEFYGRPC